MKEKEVFSEAQISAAVDRAFARMGREKKAREEARKSSAQAARDRMIERQTTDKPNAKENPESGTGRIPVWSNFR